MQPYLREKAEDVTLPQQYPIFDTSEPESRRQIARDVVPECPNIGIPRVFCRIPGLMPFWPANHLR